MMASHRCTRLAGDPHMPVAPAGGHSSARTATARTAQAVRRPAGLVFAHAGHTACVVAAGPGSHVVPRIGLAAGGSSGCVVARGRMRVCSRLGCCEWAGRCALAQETGAARMRQAFGTWREARSHCRLLFGRNSSIRSFGSAKSWASSQYLHGLIGIICLGTFWRANVPMDQIGPRTCVRQSPSWTLQGPQSYATTARTGRCGSSGPAPACCPRRRGST